MNKISKKLGVLSILVLATQQINLPGLGLSIFQVVVLLFLLVSFLPSILCVRRGKNINIACIWFASSVIAFFTSINPDWARSYFLLGTLFSMLLVVVPSVFCREDIPLLEKWLIRSQYIVIPFSIYCWIFFYSVGGVPDKVPLPGGLSVTLGEDAIARGTAGGEIRLMLPYATPPVLSIVMSMCVTLLLFSEGVFKKYTKWILITIFSTIALMTGSRSGLVGLFLLIIFLFFTGEIRRYLGSNHKIYLVLGIFCFLFLLLIFLENEYLEKMIFDRFKNTASDGLYEDRHFLVPLDGLIIWLDSLSNFFIGIGFGSSALMKGEHTYLPPYFLNSYVTLLAERGILGFVLVFYIIKLVVKLFKARRFLSKNENALVYTLFVGLISGIFYENLNCYFIIYTIAISFILYNIIDNKLNHESTY